MVDRNAPPPTGTAGSPEPDRLLEQRAGELLDEPQLREAWQRVRAEDSRTLQDQAELTAIPAPPFGEAPRAARMAQLLQEAGLDDVRSDTEGSIVGRFAHSTEPERLPLVISAHLDTVFSADTPVKIRADDGTLCAPGISDDGRGLAALLALAREMTRAGLALRRPLLFVATVGEEGPGDLRGVRHLFGPEGAASSGCAGFISLDGAGLSRIVTSGLGSRRFAVRMVGPGGHSWSDRGLPHPIHALAPLVAGLARVPVPDDAALNVGRWGGGTSVNAIPSEAWIEFEIRSERPTSLASLEKTARDALVPDGELQPTIEVIGDRPAGATPHTAPLVRAAVAATRTLGEEPQLARASTDANIPMALDLPAITVGAGGEAGLVHTVDEWYRNERGPEGILRVLLTLVLVDRLLSDPPAPQSVPPSTAITE